MRKYIKTFEEFINESKNVYDKFPISALITQAKKFNNFKDFSYFYSHDIYHGWYWHFTIDKKFKYSEEIGSRDMTLGGEGEALEKGSFMVTSDFDAWCEYYQEQKDDFKRNYAVLIDASDLEPKKLKQVSRGFGNEVYLHKEDVKKLKFIEVCDIKTAKRLDKKFDKMIPGSEEELKKLYNIAKNEIH